MVINHQFSTSYCALSLKLVVEIASIYGRELVTRLGWNPEGSGTNTTRGTPYGVIETALGHGA